MKYLITLLSSSLPPSWSYLCQSIRSKVCFALNLLIRLPLDPPAPPNPVLSTQYSHNSPTWFHVSISDCSGKEGKKSPFYLLIKTSMLLISPSLHIKLSSCRLETSRPLQSDAVRQDIIDFRVGCFKKIRLWVVTARPISCGLLLQPLGFSEILTCKVKVVNESKFYDGVQFK